MDKLLFLLCALILAATPVQGAGLDPAPRSPGLKLPGEKEAVRPPPARPRLSPRDEDASTGSTTPQRRGGTDLGYEAEKEEEAYLKKKRTGPFKSK